MGHAERWGVWQPVSYVLGLKELECLYLEMGSRTTVFKHCEDCHIEDDRIRKHKGTRFGWLNTKSMIG